MAKPTHVHPVQDSYTLTSTAIKKAFDRRKEYAPVKQLSLSSYLWNRAVERSQCMNEESMILSECDRTKEKAPLSPKKR